MNNPPANITYRIFYSKQKSGFSKQIVLSGCLKQRFARGKNNQRNK
jgi:hypothetical protein